MVQARQRVPLNAKLSGIQALRAAAALLVVFIHLGATKGIEAHYLGSSRPIFGAFSEFGFFGVDIFFVISGFIIYTTTADRFAERGISVEFLLRRIVRIYPPYWLILIPLMAVYILAPSHMTQLHGFQTNLVASFFLLPQLSDETRGIHPLLDVSWTLVYEMYFYIIFSVLLALPRRLLVPALVVWFMAQSLFALFLPHTNAYLTFLGTPLSIEFMFGVVIGILHVKGYHPVPIAMTIVAALAAGTLWAFSGVASPITGLERVVVWGIPAALVVYAVVALEVRRGAKFPLWTVSLGDASYALYLWHLPVMVALAQVLGKHVHGSIMHLAAVCALVACALAVALAVYRYLERPMTRYLNAFVANLFVSTAAT